MQTTKIQKGWGMGVYAEIDYDYEWNKVISTNKLSNNELLMELLYLCENMCNADRDKDKMRIDYLVVKSEILIRMENEEGES